MARVPRDVAEAVEALDVRAGSTVVAVGPDHGFVEELATAVGDDGTLLVQDPPPDLDAPKGVKIVDAVPEGTKAQTVIAWLSVIPVHSARELGDNVDDKGALWLVIPKVERAARAPVTEGDVKRAMLSAGWREERVQPLSKDAFAVRFRRRS